MEIENLKRCTYVCNVVCDCKLNECKHRITFKEYLEQKEQSLKNLKKNIKMKKISIILAICLLSIASYSQSVFGVQVDGSKTEVINKFKAKGFKIPITPSLTVTTLRGSIDGVKYDVLVCNTPITKKVWKIVVYLPEQNNWYDLKSTYEKFYDLFVKKYGEPLASYSSFTSPYEEGDGYEMTAVSVEKCNYSAFWNEVWMNISKFKQIELNYENVTNAELFTAEKEKLNTKNF